MGNTILEYVNTGSIGCSRVYHPFQALNAPPALKSTGSIDDFEINFGKAVTHRAKNVRH